MKKFKGIIISIVIGIILIAGIIFFNRTVDSKIEGFPVPARAKYIYDEQAKDYQYKCGCFQYSLPFLYMRSIKSKGWKEVSNEGEARLFQKGNRKVVFFHPTGDNNIYLYESTKKDT
ncbi:hypothetical protein ACFDTO_21445 [Microbacteriaceae bacterium 4G12]